MIAVGYSKRISNLIVKETVPIKEQNDRIREYAKSHGFKITRFYEDKSNDPESDSGFQEMRIDGMNRKFDLVVLESLYRCGRNFAYAKNLLYMTFYKLGIHFVVLEEGINTMTMTEDDMERFFRELRGQHAGVVELSSRQEHYKTQNQITDNWERYGYRLNEDRTEIIVDEEAAKTIRYVFEQASSGVKKCDIARHLNANHVETPSIHLNRVAVRRRGLDYEKWVSGSVSRILKAKVYMGDDHALMTEGVTYPRIIEPELYEKAQATYYRLSSKRYRKHYLFKRMVFDGESGEMLGYREKEINGRHVEYYHLPQDDRPLVEYGEVLGQVRKCLDAERKRAEAVLGIREEIRDAKMNEIDDSYRDKAKEMFLESLAAQDGKVELYRQYANGQLPKEEYETRLECIMKRQKEVNDRFQEMMKEIMKRKTYLGKENPWIRRFVKYDPEKELDCPVVNERVRRIEVYPDCDIRVFLNTDGMEFLPDDYLKEAGVYGQKEQKN